MKKALLLVSVLGISVITTACINSFAVQELNNKAKVYMEQGNYSEAIERLKSSIDLDDSLFESHYNLAVAYTNAEDYINAMEAYKKAIKLKPDFADSYYSLAVTEENIASDLSTQTITIDDNGNLVRNNNDNVDSVPDKISPQTEIYINELLSDAVKNYNEYLTRGENLNDAEDVKTRIKDLELKISTPATEE